MSNYYLAKDSFVCESGGHAVFLDLRRDRYVALPPEDMDELGTILPGFLKSRRPVTYRHDCATEGRLAGLAHLLEREGLLVRDQSRGKLPDVNTAKVPKASFWTSDGPLPHLRFDHLVHFLTARVHAALTLKLLPISVAVGRVHTRRSLRAAEPVVDDLRSLIGVFFVLQSLFLAGSDACLMRSLTMIEFLARYDLYPMWVFGVRVQPFEAHCWVQEGTVVLNDSDEHVRGYTPIMTV